MSGDASQPTCVAVAFSGGRDSTALLHATARAALAYPGSVVLALHVHHGLSSHADDWLAHAEQVCADWATQGLPVRLVSRRVQVGLGRGDSVEAQARRVRYQALASMAREAGCELVLLAHHRRDQAETFLLQALRGAGLNGLTAMPPDAVREGVRWVRPWLAYPREAVEAYVAHHALRWVDDDSNTHVRFARNRLRLDVWSALVDAFPQAEASLAASARRLQDVLPAAEVWRAELVASLLVSAEAGLGRGARLDAPRWAELSGPQRRESLRHWYRSVAEVPLAATWVERLAHELPALVFRGRSARWAEIGLTLYRGELAFLPADTDVGAQEGAALSDSPREAVSLEIAAPGEHAVVGWPGRLRVTPVSRGGVAPELLAGAVARPRSGGEQYQAGPGRPPRALKKQYQAAGVPSWCRGGPLIWSGDTLVFVPGLGVDARCLAPEGEPQWGLEWVVALR